jgi:hypothetical protein
MEMNIVSKFNQMAKVANTPLHIHTRQSLPLSQARKGYSLILQSANLRHEEPSQYEDQRADDVAKLQLRQFEDIASEQNHDLSEQKQQSKCL